MDGDSVLTRIADDDDHLQTLFDLDHATNDRLRAENDLLPGIGIGELVFGIAHYRIVNAAFTPDDFVSDRTVEGVTVITTEHCIAARGNQTVVTGAAFGVVASAA